MHRRTRAIGALALAVSVFIPPAEAHNGVRHGAPPTAQALLACNHEGCVFGTPEGVVHDGFKYSASSAPGTGSVPWNKHVSYQPPGTTFNVRLCNGAIPYSTEDCGPSVSMVSPQPPKPQTVAEVIRYWFPSNYERASGIAWCESRHDPRAVSPGGGNHGLFQINNVHAGRFESVTGRPWSTGRYEAYANANYARWLYDREGWKPWTCA